MKRVLSVLIAIILCIGLIPMTVSAETVTSGTCGDNLTWIFKNGTLTISGTGAMFDYDYPWDVPWSSSAGDVNAILIGDGVTTIGKNAFSYCSDLLSLVSFSADLTAVKEDAFRKDVSFYVVYTGTSAQAEVLKQNIVGVPKIKKIDWYCEASVNTIGNLTYIVQKNSALVYRCNTEASGTVTIPVKANEKPVTEIMMGAFYGCEYIERIEMPDTVIKVGESAFRRCYALKTIKLSNKLEDLGAYAFEDDVELDNVTLPYTLKSIGSGAFAYCKSLSSIKIPSKIASLEWAFNECKNLKTIILPKSVSSIKDNSFCNAGLTDVYYEGSSEDKSAISFGIGNDPIKNATWHLDATKFYADTQTFTDNGSLSVKYSVSPSYTVTIPSEVNLGENVTVSAENVVLLKGKKLTVAITETSDANNDFKLKTTEGAELSYTVTVGDTPVSVGTAFLTVNPETSASGSATLSFVAPTSAPQFAGEYEGTVTFYFSVE